MARLSQSICDCQPCSTADSALEVWSTGTHVPVSSSWYTEAAIPLGEASDTRCVFLVWSCGARYVLEFIMRIRVWKLASLSSSHLKTASLVSSLRRGAVTSSYDWSSLWSKPYLAL